MSIRDSLTPLIDENNPFYCPAVPAALYLQSLRNRNQNREHPRSHLSGYSARVLGSSSDDHKRSDSDGSDWVIRELFAGDRWFSSQLHPSEDLPPYSPSMPTRGQMQNQVRTNGVVADTKTPDIQVDTKPNGGFSDFDAPPKYAQSVVSCHTSSFDLEVCHERLHFDGVVSSPISMENFLKGLDPIVDDLGSLTHKLDAALPGVRLKERLWELNPTKAQDLMDFISEKGYINEGVLHILSRSLIECIVFAPSMSYENGLNILGSEIYSVFSKPDTFRCLSEISFAGVRIRDSDLQYFHHLPKLAVLNLNETGIGNEGVFLLISLKQTLKKLYLATNHDINDDAVPAILVLSKLSFLSILDTGIEMAGLRRLAEAMHEYNWVLDVEIPFICESYIDSIQSEYLRNPQPPLITNPYVCAQLSNVALMRNLEAHAACNSSIIASGSRAEMIERLSKILLIRKLDMLVIGMLQGNDFVPEDQ